MKRTILPILLLLTLLLAACNEDAPEVDGPEGVLPEGTEGDVVDEALLAPDAPDVVRLLDAADLIGMDVVRRSGEEVGAVAEALFAPDGTVAVYLIEVTDFAAISDEPLDVAAVPGGSLRPALVDRLVDVGGDPSADVGVAVVLVGPEQGATIASVREEALLSAGLFVEPAALAPVTDGMTAERLARLGRFAGPEALDHPLVDEDGEAIGALSGLIVDVVAAEVAYAVLEVGALEGANVVAPWSAVELAGDTIVLVADESLLAEAPRLLPGDPERPAGLFLVDADLREAVRAFWSAAGFLEE